MTGYNVAHDIADAIESLGLQAMNVVLRENGFSFVLAPDRERGITENVYSNYLLVKGETSAPAYAAYSELALIIREELGY